MIVDVKVNKIQNKKILKVFDKYVSNGTKDTFLETTLAPEHGWLEDDCFLLGWHFFRGVCC